jgi:hypothetical protein
MALTIDDHVKEMCVSGLVVIKVLQCLISYPNIMEIKSAMSK